MSINGVVSHVEKVAKLMRDFLWPCIWVNFCSYMFAAAQSLLHSFLTHSFDLSLVWIVVWYSHPTKMPICIHMNVNCICTSMSYFISFIFHMQSTFNGRSKRTALALQRIHTLYLLILLRFISCISLSFYFSVRISRDFFSRLRI